MEKMPSAESAAESQAQQDEVPSSSVAPIAIKAETRSVPTGALAPPTPITAPATIEGSSQLAQATLTISGAATSQKVSAASPQAVPVAISTKTRKVQLSLLRDVLSVHGPSDWITHSVMLSEEINAVRLAVKEELLDTEDAMVKSRALESTLAARHYSVERIDAFVIKVLGVLDGIAKAEELEKDDTKSSLPEVAEDFEAEVAAAMTSVCEATREAMTSFAILYEYLSRGREAQETRKMDVLRRLKVLEGMVARGDTVSAVVRYLLMDNGE